LPKKSRTDQTNKGKPPPAITTKDQKALAFSTLLSSQETDTTSEDPIGPSSGATHLTYHLRPGSQDPDLRPEPDHPPRTAPRHASPRPETGRDHTHQDLPYRAGHRTAMSCIPLRGNSPKLPCSPQMSSGEPKSPPATQQETPPARVTPAENRPRPHPPRSPPGPATAPRRPASRHPGRPHHTIRIQTMIQTERVRWGFSLEVGGAFRRPVPSRAR
jgi:hypothetical protein